MNQIHTVEVLLRQQRDFLNDRFDAIDERFDRVEHMCEGLGQRLAAVETQVRLTNGQVIANRKDIDTLQNPDDATKPLLTRAEGKLLGKAVGLSVSVGTSLFFVIQWVASNWAAVLPAIIGMVKR